MSAPHPALANDHGTTRIRVGIARMTPLEARQLAFELFEIADLADHANGVNPAAGGFVPPTAAGLDGDSGGVR